MKSCEQQARDMLDSMSCVRMRDEEADEWSAPEDMSAGELVELANLIAERSRLRKWLSEALDGWAGCLESISFYTGKESTEDAARIDELRSKATP